MPALAPLLVREVHGVLAKRAVDHTVIEAVVVSKSPLLPLVLLAYCVLMC